MAYIFLDESGQFSKNNKDNYFIIGSFTVGNPRRTEKQFKVWQRTKFPRKSKNQKEIKFSEINITDSLRIKTLKFIANLDVRVHCAYFLKKNIPEEYSHKNTLQSGILYTEIIGETLGMYLPITDREFRVFCDKRSLKGIKNSEFKNILRARLFSQLPKDSIIQIEMIDSKMSSNIQIADWISGSLAWYFEEKHLGQECYQVLKNNLLGNCKELFKDYWDNKYKNKNPNQKD